MLFFLSSVSVCVSLFERDAADTETQIQLKQNTKHKEALYEADTAVPRQSARTYTRSDGTVALFR
jgi:hypothetical protein